MHQLQMLVDILMIEVGRNYLFGQMCGGEKVSKLLSFFSIPLLFCSGTYHVRSMSVTLGMPSGKDPKVSSYLNNDSISSLSKTAGLSPSL